MILKNGTIIADIENPPMLTIIDDDGYGKFYTELVPLITSRGVPLCSAVPPQRPNNSEAGFMTWEQIVEASRAGAEILNHTYSHLTGDIAQDMTVQEIWLDYQKARNELETHGLAGGKYLVYAGASGNLSTAKAAAQMSCDLAFHAGGNKINRHGYIDPYHILRYRVEPDFNFDLDAMKELIDANIAQGGWMVWMIHTSMATWTSLNGLSAITGAIDYAIAQGLPIVTVAHAARVYL